MISRTASRDSIITSSNSKKDLRSLAAQTIFRVLDYIRAWQNHRIEELTQSQQGKGSQLHLKDRSYQSISSFFKKIPKDLIAKAALASNSPTRALLYFEEYIDSRGSSYNMSTKPDDLGFLLRIYNSVDEPDGVHGLDQIRRSELSLMDRIHVFESKGNHLDASVCYEEAISKDPENVGLHVGLLKCFTKMGQLSAVLSQVRGLTSKHPDWTSQLLASRVECAWKLNQWDNLKEFLAIADENQHTNNTTPKLSAGKFEFNLGKIFLSLQNEKEDEFKVNLDVARLAEIGPLSAAAMETGSYTSGYQHVVKLQILNELESVAKNFVFNSASESQTTEQVLRKTLTETLKHLESSFDSMQPSYRNHDCLLNFRRTLFFILQGKTKFPVVKKRLGQEIGHCWLKFARSSRHSAHHQTAFLALNNARSYQLLEFPIEQAKLLASTGEKTEALNFLEKQTSATFDKYKVTTETRSDSPSYNYAGDEFVARIHAETLLLYARFTNELDLIALNPQVQLFHKVTRLEGGANWEKAYYLTGKCVRKHLKRQEEVGESSGRRYNLMKEIFRNYIDCLRHGSQFFYQTLPFIFEKWFELATKVSELEKAKKTTDQIDQKLDGYRKQLLDLTQDHIKTITKLLQPYQLLVVFPQLISRICHSHALVFSTLSDIIVHVMKAFPQQTFWQVVQVSNSVDETRKKRINKITNVFSKEDEEGNKENSNLLKCFHLLSDHLIKVCTFKPEGCSILSLSRHFRAFEAVLTSPKFPRIVIPFKDALYPILPNDQLAQNRDHRPFPLNSVCIQSFQDEIEVLKSLQKPKKVKIRGTDGKIYNILCKAEDDLRKDSRFLEFNGIVNKCLRKDPATRQKELYIRTFAVIPLSEKAGLVEWIPNLMPMRQIILKQHKENGTGLSGHDINAKVVEWTKAPADSEERRQIFHKLLSGFSPPVFHLFFPRTFSEPSKWYRARTNYARTTAVMSMVGFVVGLGDRHGENILCDSMNGDAVHVDFDCLFNKGETLKVPENIPFRLTQNVIDGFGPMGIEGVFRCACEAALRVMREEQEALLSAMTAFLYDPLVEWTRDGKRKEAPSRTVPESGEFQENAMAMESLQNLKQRLRGEGKKRRGMPLSVEGQVQELLRDAADIKKLETMYIGWAPYL